ncbi:hypothetical protein Rsub_05208 [Raphidocelis subcapitata]|uniref:Saccharopine dehydrogenase NADP binding domain-containing protein n=1 Tax=Raphidocelis subcapitata TaxID=307507 RepID=A0A2V0NY87_9CHLO|nr:hypothetical protein Rsub_05208 [Raphidocelis subcapitata]|eukprot:GBF92594.1 hypothetical protein Rsub_05208 [Raphidocelis subcapitata]
MAPPPRAQRPFDVCVFGASGFTGARVAEELAAQCAAAGLRAALAGRDEGKLRALAGKLPNGGDLGIVAGVDVSDPASVERLVGCCRLLLNCVGPYRFYGEPVFGAAAAAGTDYLDLCGEPEFIERMELAYAQPAAASGALMACASAFDSIPNDLGTILVAREFRPPAVPSSVESVIRVSAPLGLPIHFATWESAVHGIGSAQHLQRVRAEAKKAGRGKAPKLVGPRPRGAQGPVWDAALGAYTLPFPGADASVVRRTQMALGARGEPAVHFSARFAVATRYYAAVAVVVGATLMTLAKHGWGRALLLRNPGLMSYGLVSHAGPTQEQMEAATTEVTFVARGFSAPPESADAKPDKRVDLKIGLGDPGYLYTAKMMVAAAMALVEERAKVLESVGGSGGVFTAGFLLRDTSLPERLKRAGMTFEFKHDEAGAPAAAEAAA